MDWIELAPDSGHCECGNGAWGSVKCGEITDWLRTG
jgi:hypothetical protein